MSIASRALHGVNVCIIPSPYNNDKPLALRHRSLATVSAALVAIKVIALLTVALVPAPAELSVITANRIIQLTNAERTAAGLPALASNTKLTAAAQDKGKHMLEQDYFAHISPSGVTPWFWIKKHGYAYLVAGENLAIDFTEAEDTVAAWMASPTHKANIMHDEYTETGVAVVSGEFQGGTSTIVVHMFGLPTGGSAPTEPSTAGTTQNATPTPTPSASPAPTTTPAPVSTDAPAASPNPQPPRVPRIALAGNTATVSDSVSLTISAEPASTVHVVANTNPVNTTDIPSSGTALATVDISSLPDGTVSLRAYATQEGLQSELSESVTVTKDTSGPELAREDIAFLISPAFDTTQAAAYIPSIHGEADVRLVNTLAPATVSASDEHGNTTTLNDIALAPVFEAKFSDSELRAPHRILTLSRRMAAAVFAMLVILLGVAVIVRAQVQHPALITHASAAILLAGVLFLI